MRKNTEDKTLYRNYVQKWKFLIREYELVRQKRHPKFRFAADSTGSSNPSADLLQVLSPVPPAGHRRGPGPPASRPEEKSPGLRVY